MSRIGGGGRGKDVTTSEVVDSGTVTPLSFSVVRFPRVMKRRGGLKCGEFFVSCRISCLSL